MIRTCRIFPLAVIGVASIALSTLAGCGQEGRPAPSPTVSGAFASDEEAYQAAEATYNRYAEAINRTDLSDAKTFDPVFVWLTGAAEAAERKGLSDYHAYGLARIGDTTFDSFTPLSYEDDTVLVNVCLDVSAVDLVRDDGSSALGPTRADRRAVQVLFVPGETETGLVVARNSAPEDFTC